MNAGQYPLGDGRTLGARRVIGVSGRLDSVSQNNIVCPDPSNFASFAGLNSFSAAPAAGVRTRLYSAMGRGAARLFIAGVEAACTFRIEAYVDGNRVYDRTITFGGASAQGQAVVGFTTKTATSSDLVPDYLPFDASFEVYITITQAGQTARWCYLVEAHQ